MVMESRIDGHRDQFPVGMRVLAVDDDPTCLRLLEALLRRCQYHVTTTSHAITALKLLRDNKNKFDLVISDVHMPDMDGFKLLELVGLEMDLPVIMLSANGDPKLVMKGVTHGACDYLLKPVRIEELKNIWQHVIRRKKFDSRDHRSDNWDKLQTETGEGGLISARSGNSDGKLNKRRKEQNENGIEEHTENENDNEDSSTHKKQRVVWTVELHQKFVAAVNQLGIDKAVPKKILDSMNVENLTRENVASHLQKYRLYLKRISSVSSPQAHMVAPFGNPDSPYLRFGSVNGFGNYHTQFQRTPGSFPPSGMLGRLNTSIGITHGSYSPRMAQLCHSQNVSNPINDWRKFQPVPLPGDQNGSMVQGMPTPSRPDQLQHDKVVNCIGDLPTAFDDSTVFSASGALLSTQTIGSSGNSLARAHNNPFSLHKHPGGTQSRKQLGSQSSISVASSNSICSDNWQSGINSSTIQSNSLPMGDSFRETNLDPSSLGDDFSSMTPLIEKHPCAVSSTTLAPSQLQDPRRNPHCQAANVNARENMKCSPNQAWDDQRQDNSSNSKVMFNSLHSSSPTCGVMDPLDQYLDPKNLNLPGNMDASFVTREDFVDPLPIQLDVEKSAMETTLNLKQGYLNTHWKPQNGNVCNNFGSLEDVLGAMMKQEQDDDLNVIDGDFGCDAYSIRACI